MPGKHRIGGHVGRIGAVLALALLSLVPIADWIPGGPESVLPPPHGPQYLLWVVGLAVMAGVSWVAVKVIPWAKDTGRKGGGSPPRRGRRVKGASPETGSPPAPSGPAERGPVALPSGWIPVLLLLVVPALLYAWTSWSVFDGRPLHVDAMTQALQAHVFADGRLSAPVAAEPRFFSSALLIEDGGRAFSQFPPGWSGLLAIGLLLGVPWLVAPLLGGVAVYALWRVLRDSGESPAPALFASALLALSPWYVLNAASWMSHVPTLCFILLGTAALLRGTREPSSRLWPFLAGAGLGVAALIRPLEGVAFGIPATVWVVARAWREPGARRAAAAFAAGGALTLGLLLVHNQVMHGSPTLFGFELQWGPEHRLGFHEAPWGPPHTVSRGFQLLANYLLALQLLFFDAPAPSLLLALVALALARRLDALDRYLLAGCGLVLLGYFAFWGEGHDLGPRYLIPLAPVAAIWTARFATLLGERTGRADLRRWGYAMVVLLLASGWLLGTPTRWFVFGRSDPLRRVDVTPLEQPRARDALVFVSSPWSIQVQARLRATGMSRQQAEWFYHRVGLCRLDLALSELETGGVSDAEQVVAALRPLAADSASMVLDPLSGSPGDPYTGMERTDSAGVAVCGLRQYLEETQGGYMILPFQAALGPTWTGDGPIVARDLHEQNRLLLEAYPDRDPYYLRPVAPSGRVRRFVLEPLKPDSVERVWGTFRELQEKARVF